MDWLYQLDVGLFQFVHQSLRNSFLDWLLPYFSSNKAFYPAAAVLVVALLWKGGLRGNLFVAMLALVIAVGEGIVCDSLKDALARPRPFVALPNVEPLVGMGGSGSMPSSHSVNWFACAVLAGIYWRRSLYFLLPLACLVGFSRVYVGAHYPSDVLVGALVGVAVSAALAWGLDLLWRKAGVKWFPIWHQRLPSLLARSASIPDNAEQNRSAREPSPLEVNQHWLRLGYVFIVVLFVFRLGYIASGRIELSEDEAYQWVWSKHLALSYYSKPPMIAYAQFLGTSLWGDTAFGVRFFSPVLAAVLSVLLLRFFAREASAQAGFWLLIIVATTPLLAVGGTLMTIDPLSVFFWTAAMLSGWRAVKENSTPQWLLTGLWIGLGFLSKYIALVQIACWAVFFILWPPARVQLRRPGPWLALLIVALCTLPVLIWNAQHGWITVTHLANRGGLTEAWRPTIRFLRDFLLSELGLLNPVFFIGMVWACVGFWRWRNRDPLLLYLFSMGAPLFLFYTAYTLRARVLPNWIAPAVLPMICVMVVYWERRWRNGAITVPRWLAGGVALGLLAVIPLHETRLISKVTGKFLPAKSDPLTRVRGWRETARVVGEARDQLLQEGKPVFVIGSHYGITGLLSFYMPEARARIGSDALVYYLSSDVPRNQFYFWPGYKTRQGENAIYVQLSKQPHPPPENLLKEFSSVTDLGLKEINYRGRGLRQVQLFACRGLR